MLIPVGADQVWAEDSGGEGVPLVLLHPGITDSTVWDGLLPHLGEHRVVRYDRRGYGQSPAGTEPYRPVDDLVGVLDHLAVDRAHLVGNSMGGETALALAVTAPERVASLTLLCPAVGGYPWPEPNAAEQALYAEFGRLVEARDLDGLARMALEQWCASGQDDYLREQLRATTEIEFGTGADTATDNPEQWEVLPDLAVPTAVIAGEMDPRDSLMASIDLAGRIPGAELVRTPWDHLPQYRDPAAVAQVVLRTIGRN